jgi:hypothetical protein
MSLRIPAIRRLQTPTDPHEQVHFHLYADGRPYVCDLHRCESPALRVQEISTQA